MGNGREQNLVHFQKGVSGNPSGLSKELAEVRKLAREHSIPAMRKLIALAGLAENGEGKAHSQRMQIEAIDRILDRAMGKPKQTIEYEGEGPMIASITVNFVKAEIHGGQTNGGPAIGGGGNGKAS